MDVAIDRHCGTDLVVALKTADGDGDIVDHAESFAVVGKCVMESTADADRNFVNEALLGCEDGAPSSEPECVCQLTGIWDLHFHFFALAERACPQFLDVLG